jgi:hypothetical protein
VGSGATGAYVADDVDGRLLIARSLAFPQGHLFGYYFATGNDLRY